MTCCCLDGSYRGRIAAMGKDKKTVLLGMSGGTDSSVAALLLLDAGYEVTGVTFRFYERDGDTEYLDDARGLCDSLGIPHLVYDAREVFRERIIRYFIQEYMEGRTPVPCTLCNNCLKWPLLKQIADREGIACLATGHYVRKRFIGGYWHIACGEDPDKDQSFFLWGLPQEILSRVVLPLGGLNKTRVREIAAERGFMKAARKRDSLGVCFCPGDYRSFLREHVPPGRILPGYFYDEAGACLGKHEGYPFYTIGQRRGLGIYMNKALFVKEILVPENKIIITDSLQALEREEMFLTGWNAVNPDALFGRDDVIVRIRYRKQANRCVVTPEAGGRLRVRLYEPLASVASGQAAAFYRGDILLGGGIIV